VTRPYGDGSVFWDQRRRRWVGIYTAGRDVSGNRIRRKVTGRNKTEARKRLRTLQRTTVGGQPAPSGALRLGAFLDQWLDEVVPLRVSSTNTVDNYRWAVNQHIKPALGTRRLRDLTPDDVDSFLRAKRESLGPSSVMRLRAVLVQALRHGERYGHVTRNVAALVDLPRTPQSEGRSLTVAQARKLLEMSKGDRLSAAIWCGLLLGLRPGELLGLSWADVDLDAGRLTVRRSLKRERGVLKLGNPKTRKSTRTLEVPPLIVVALRSHWVRRAAERLAAGSLWTENDLVFATQLGTPTDPSNLRRSTARITKRAGLGQWHPHELRHSAASLLSDAGVPLEQVADVLGHQDVRTTSNVYRHRVADSITAAAAPMQELFGDQNQRAE
jgi:integrase